LEVVGEVGKTDLVMRICERYLTTQPIVTKRVRGEEGRRSGKHEAGAQFDHGPGTERAGSPPLCCGTVGDDFVVQRRMLSASDTAALQIVASA
jgi:hypothetical protein